jgi:Rrf2 family transcriptional regulator, iron-sulfur cluster assembly transcription factor
MNFTKTTSYSLKILGFMAENQKDTASASHIHEALGIPYPYLRQLMQTLSEKGFIKSEKGRNGGFLLLRKPEEIFLIEIVEAMEGTSSLDRCMMGVSDCRLQEKCALHEPWVKIKTELLGLLKNTSLNNLVSTVK